MDWPRDGMRYRARVFEHYHKTAPQELQNGRSSDPSVYERGFRLRYLPLLPSDKNARILDLGCGLGLLLAFLRKEGYLRCVGIDGSPEMAQLARNNSGVPIEQAEAVSYLRAHPGEFDAVMAMDVLEHMYKDELIDCMDAVRLALKPGGCFLAHTTNTDGLLWGRMRYIDFTHETGFTRYSLSQLFTVTGFVEHEFYPDEPLGTGLRGLACKALWAAYKLALGVFYSMEGGSGIRRNDHIFSSSVIAKTRKPVVG